MTTGTSPALNLYFSVDSAQLAQTKYSHYKWHDRLATVSAIAYVALAAVANIYLFTLASPFTLLCFNYSLYSLAKSTLAPFLRNHFSLADRFKAQGDREAQIHAKFKQLQAMSPLEINALRTECELHRSPSPSLDTEKINRMLARLVYWNKQHSNLNLVAERLFAQRNTKKAIEIVTAAMKAKAKAAFCAALLVSPTHAGKFKNSFAWVNTSTEDRWIQSLHRDSPHDALVQTRENPPKILIKMTDDFSVDQLAGKLIPPPDNK